MGPNPILSNTSKLFEITSFFALPIMLRMMSAPRRETAVTPCFDANLSFFKFEETCQTCSRARPPPADSIRNATPLQIRVAPKT